ncbi:MAG: LapA family protein [Solirubrobacterales bacterium]|nr:LapA family protein [Solirubrobacterales bacterium]MBV9715235.1 LapA family protein [Solirubrobacterales bacterium]
MAETDDRAGAPARSSGGTIGPRERARLIAAAVIAALVAAFAVLNFNDVKVHWIIRTGQTPLTIVIAVAFVLGIVIDRLLVVRSRRRRQP